jgi:hypothetical protein
MPAMASPRGGVQGPDSVAEGASCGVLQTIAPSLNGASLAMHLSQPPIFCGRAAARGAGSIG